MNDMSPIGIGHNGGPDPLDEATSVDQEALALAEGLLVGLPVENDAQMDAVDAVRARVKILIKAVEDAKDGEYRPHKAACDKVIAKYKPTLTDLSNQDSGLKKMVDGYKQRREAARQEAERKARAEADATRRAAEDAARAAHETDLETQRQAMAAQHEAEEAQRRVVEISRDKTKKMREVEVTEVLDGTGYARWLWQNDRDWLLAAMQARATSCRHHIPSIVETRKERRAI